MHQLTPTHATLKHCPQSRRLQLNEGRSHAHSSSLVRHHHAQPCLPAKTPTLIRTRIIVSCVSLRLLRCSCRAAHWRTFACMTLAAACELLRRLLMMQWFHDSSGREHDDSTGMMCCTDDSTGMMCCTAVGSILVWAACLGSEGRGLRRRQRRVFEAPEILRLKFSLSARCVKRGI